MTFALCVVEAYTLTPSLSVAFTVNEDCVVSAFTKTSVVELISVDETLNRSVSTPPEVRLNGTKRRTVVQFVAESRAWKWNAHSPASTIVVATSAS